MSIEVKIVQTAVEKKPLPLKVILGADFLYGAYDEEWRLHSGKMADNQIICYMPMQLARGIAVNWSEDEVDMISIRTLIPTVTVELRALYEMIYRICNYWQCELIVDDKPMDLDEFMDGYPAILAFNQKSLNDMARSILNGENEEITIYSTKWPLVMGKNEAEAFVVEPSYFSKWLHDKQKIDAHHTSPTFYREDHGVVGRFVIGEDVRCILPTKPYVPYGYNDPETGELIECDEYAVVIFDIKKCEPCAEMEYKEFIAALRRKFSSKIKGYDGKHLLMEPLTMDELRKIIE